MVTVVLLFFGVSAVARSVGYAESARHAPRASSRPRSRMALPRRERTGGIEWPLDMRCTPPWRALPDGLLEIGCWERRSTGPFRGTTREAASPTQKYGAAAESAQPCCGSNRRAVVGPCSPSLSNRCQGGIALTDPVKSP